MTPGRRRAASAWRALAVLVQAALLAACAATPQTEQLLDPETRAIPEKMELLDIPFFPQQEYQCGPAALATLLQAAGSRVTPDALVRRVYIPDRHGSLQLEMLAAARDYGLVPLVLSPSLQTVLREVVAGRPVLVLQNLGLDWYQAWHYAVVIGYDLNERQIILHSGTTPHYRLALRTFERTWQRADHWSVVLLRPGELAVDGDDNAYFQAAAAFGRHQPAAAVEKVFAAGLQRWPENRLLAMGLGNLYYSNGDTDRAIVFYRRVIAGEPDFAPAHNNLAQALDDLGEHEAALAHARRAVALGGDHSDQYLATLQAIERGRVTDSKN